MSEDVTLRSTKPYPRQTNLKDPQVVCEKSFENGGIAKFKCYLVNETLYSYLEFDPQRSFLIYTPPKVNLIELVLHNLGAIDDQLPDYIRDDLQDTLRIKA